MQTIETKAGMIHCRDEGPRDGQVIMFGNSLGTDFRVWDEMLPHLPDGLRIVRFDKRGHGLSACPDAPYDVEELVDDAEAIVDVFELGDIIFVGLSIGGLIGQGLAKRRPDLMKGLVLMDTAAKIGTAEMWAERIAAIRAGGIAAIEDGILDRWFAPGFRKDEARLGPWRAMLTRTPVEGYCGCGEAISGADYTESTKRIKIPVLAMAGEHDGSTPPDLVKATADLCGGEFHVVKNAGHLPCVEQPEATGRLIADFIAQVTIG